MISIASLWLPILVSAVFVFIASSIIHMAPLWHRRDYRGLPHEDQVTATLRPLAIPPGDYFLPWCEQKDMKSQAFQDRMRQGPVAMITILPNGPVVMGKPLALWFVYLLLVAGFSALIAGHLLPPGTIYPRVFKVVLTAAFMGYSLGLVQNSIWLRRSWVITFKSCFDGLIYAALTAGTFGWLWPHA
ncbi:MAG: hypothetical protein JSS29_12965 [Proteobacteria bacterium]|nr:hypothetical protein [Pseudomonadota bacterium]